MQGSTTRITDYAAALMHATNIRSDAEVMKKELDSVGNAMDEMYGTNWQSSGAKVTRDQFEEKRVSFDIFYQNVLSMDQTINTAVKQSQITDDETKVNVSSVYSRHE